MHTARVSASIISVIIACTVLIGTLPLAAHADTNLIQNPGFENANGGAPASWASDSWGSPKPTFTYPVAGHTGNGASVTFSKNSSGDARWQPAAVTVTPGGKYTYSTWYNSTAATEIDIEYTNTNGKLSYGFLASVPSSAGAWKQFTGTFTVPAKMQKASVYQLLDKKGTLTIDDVSLSTGSTPPPPPPPPPPPGAPSVSLSANPASITAGQSSTLTWSSANATRCTASGAWSGSKALSGTISVAPTLTATYTLACTGSGGTATQSATVTVSAKPPPPPPSNGFDGGAITLSFDDAWTSQYTNALPILKQAGFPASFYILTQPVQEGWDDYMTPAQVKSIADQGYDIQGHTVTHTDLTTLNKNKIDKELNDSKTYIKNLTGKTVTSLGYPYGSYNTTIINRAKADGYTSGRTADPTTPFGFNTKTTNAFEINSFSPTTAVSVADIEKAIDEAKAKNEWFVFSFHEIENGSSDEYATTLARFQEIVNYIRQSGIPVITMQEGVSKLGK